MSEISAPAKINMGLWVGNRDETGYHPIDTVMQTVALSDTLTISPGQEMQWASSGANLPMDAQNLVVRAYRWYHQNIAELPPVKVHLDKLIPVGAGLGGGSSDAAAMIRWARERAPVDDPGKMTDNVAVIGKDIPFFIEGGTARVRGYGEIITAIPPIREMGVVLVNPGISLATASVYQAFDVVGSSSRGDFLDRIVDALLQGRCPGNADLINDLEEPAFHVEPALRTFRDFITGLVRPAPLGLSGSGATYFVLGEDRDWAQWMAHRLSAEAIAWVRPTVLLGSY